MIWIRWLIVRLIWIWHQCLIHKVLMKQRMLLIIRQEYLIIRMRLSVPRTSTTRTTSIYQPSRKLKFKKRSIARAVRVRRLQGIQGNLINSVKEWQRRLPLLFMIRRMIMVEVIIISMAPGPFVIVWLLKTKLKLIKLGLINYSKVVWMIGIEQTFKISKWILSFKKRKVFRQKGHRLSLLQKWLEILSRPKAVKTIIKRLSIEDWLLCQII